MLHRHLNHQTLTLAAIDDIIDRGRKRDWLALRGAIVQDPSIRERIKKVCDAHTADPYAQRYHFWSRYVQRPVA
jgi:hypothetical protein